MSDVPRRAYVLELKIGADTKRDLIGVLRQLEFEISANMLTEGVSGGYSSGYTYKLDVDESITHDSWAAALDKWLEERKAKKEAELKVIGEAIANGQVVE